MYVASLNIDLFFKKVFSDPELAQSFLQDFLGVIITEFVILGIEHKFSDDSVIVKFDYRCKINGQYVIIEMQQKYKKDVIKRFYLYHCLGTGLQLETLKPIIITRPNGETYKEKDYSGIEPVLSLIWMVDDTLGFQDDFIAFTTLPEKAKDFISNDALWSQPLETILAARKETLKILNNTTKDLDFFQKNRLIYLFQDNIVKNMLNKPYGKWFEVAKKSKNPNNVKSDFDEFINNPVMAEVLRRLEKTNLEPYEFKYVSDLYQYENMLLEKEQDVMRAGEKAMRADEKAMRADEKAMRADEKAMRADEKAMRASEEAIRASENAMRAEQEAVRQKERAEKAEKAEKEKTLKAIQGFLKLGKDIPYIAGLLDLSVEEIHNLVKQIKN